MFYWRWLCSLTGLLFVFFRIHQCTEVTQDWLETTHHEMGHVYYFMSFWHQPYIYRDSANPAFHEAVGDTMSLSVSAPQHLAKIGLLEDFKPDEGKSARVPQSDAFLTTFKPLICKQTNTSLPPPPRYKLPSKRTGMNMIYYDFFWVSKTYFGQQCYCLF